MKGNLRKTGEGQRRTQEELDEKEIQWKRKRFAQSRLRQFQ